MSLLMIESGWVGSVGKLNLSEKPMKKAILFSVIFFAFGCSDQTGKQRDFVSMEPECDKQTIEKRAYFILECIKRANPISDEEPEDWIGKCEDMAVSTYCPIVQVIRTKECITSRLGDCRWYSSKTISESRKKIPTTQISE